MLAKICVFTDRKKILKGRIMVIFMCAITNSTAVCGRGERKEHTFDKAWCPNSVKLRHHSVLAWFCHIFLCLFFYNFSITKPHLVYTFLISLAEKKARFYVKTHATHKISGTMLKLRQSC